MRKTEFFFLFNKISLFLSFSLSHGVRTPCLSPPLVPQAAAEKADEPLFFGKEALSLSLTVCCFSPLSRRPRQQSSLSSFFFFFLSLDLTLSVFFVFWCCFYGRRCCWGMKKGMGKPILSLSLAECGDGSEKIRRKKKRRKMKRCKKKLLYLNLSSSTFLKRASSTLPRPTSTSPPPRSSCTPACRSWRTAT